MAMQPEALQICQFGIESTAGTAVAADKRFHSLSFEAEPRVPTMPSRPGGYLFPTDVVIGKDHTEATIRGEASVQDLLYLFSAALCIPTFASSGDGYLATFAPYSAATNAIKTLTFEKGGAGATNANRFAYGVFTDVELEYVPDRTVALSARAIGRTYTTGLTLTAAPTMLTGSILSPKNVDVYVATSVGGLGAGQIKPLSVRFRLSRLRGDVYTLDSSNASFEELVETVPEMSVDLVMPKGTTSNSYLTGLKAGTEYFLKISAVGPLIAGATYNKIDITLPIKFAEPGEGNDQDVHTATFSSVAIHDDAFNTVGGAALIEITSAVSELA